MYILGLVCMIIMSGEDYVWIGFGSSLDFRSSSPIGLYNVSNVTILRLLTTTFEFWGLVAMDTVKLDPPRLYPVSRSYRHADNDFWSDARMFRFPKGKQSGLQRCVCIAFRRRDKLDHSYSLLDWAVENVRYTSVQVASLHIVLPSFFNLLRRCSKYALVLWFSKEANQMVIWRVQSVSAPSVYLLSKLF